jgi:putative addiction module killer protein
MSALIVRQTAEFRDWLTRLRDRQAAARIIVRIRRLELGNPGNIRQLGQGLAEMKIDYGPGYRLYFVKQDAAIIVLLCGGDKSSQRRDIAQARTLAEELLR